jgi:hypothetical protein
MQHKRGEILNIMEITGEILSAKTFQTLMKNTKRSFSRFFGF